MVSHRFPRPAVRLVIVAAGVAACSAASAAAVQEVTVQAERATSTVVGRSSSGAPIELLELRHRVSYADLDLAKQKDIAVLEQRVREAAASACSELDKLHPLEKPDAACASKATDAAMADVRAASLAASEHARTVSEAHAKAMGAPPGAATTAAAPVQEVTVQAARPVTTTVGRNPTTGAPIQQVEVEHRVSYADLDLATPAGSRALEKRVSDAAAAACKELDQLYPLEKPDAACAKRAADAAMPEVHTAVKAAEAHAKPATK